MDVLASYSNQILFFLLVGLLVVIGFWRLQRFRRSECLMAADRVVDGQTADAVVLLSEEHPGSCLYGEAYYTFQVHVKPARGRNFVTEVHVRREQLRRIPQAGDRVSVRFNYSGRKRQVALNLDSIGH